MSYVLSVTEVMELIPNRYPIYYIDYVDTLEPGKKIAATENVTINGDFFRGCFPDNPAMPDALILETLAQVGSILILRSEGSLGERAYIGGINKAKFRQRVAPGDVLKYHFEVTKMKGSVGAALSVVYVNDKRVCECEFTFIVSQNA